LNNPYGAQCVNVFLAYNKDVVLGNQVSGNAIDYWETYPFKYYEKIANTEDNFPIKGDAVIWGSEVGVYGHIAICKEANVNQFTSFDQNWNVQIDGTGVCEFITHTYWGVLGWLRPYNLPQEPIGGDQNMTAKDIKGLLDASSEFEGLLDDSVGLQRLKKQVDDLPTKEDLDNLALSVINKISELSQKLETKETTDYEQIKTSLETSLDVKVNAAVTSACEAVAINTKPSESQNTVQVSIMEGLITKVKSLLGIK
jgi:hypothetical protein